MCNVMLYFIEIENEKHPIVNYIYGYTKCVVIGACALSY